MEVSPCSVHHHGLSSLKCWTILPISSLLKQIWRFLWCLCNHRGRTFLPWLPTSTPCSRLLKPACLHGTTVSCLCFRSPSLLPSGCSTRRRKLSWKAVLQKLSRLQRSSPSCFLTASTFLLLTPLLRRQWTCQVWWLRMTWLLQKARQRNIVRGWLGRVVLLL